MFGKMCSTRHIYVWKVGVNQLPRRLMISTLNPTDQLGAAGALRVVANARMVQITVRSGQI